MNAKYFYSNDEDNKIITEYNYSDYDNCKVVVEDNYSYLYDSEGEVVCSINFRITDFEMGLAFLRTFFQGRRHGIEQFRKQIEEAKKVVNNLDL